MGTYSKLAMEEIRADYNKFAREVAIDVDQRVVLKTPVDTGRARANWVVGFSRPVRRARRTVDQSGGATIVENTRKIQQAKDFVNVWISNNLPYINELENGSSRQAPAGMARLAVNETVRVFSNRRI